MAPGLPPPLGRALLAADGLEPLRIHVYPQAATKANILGYVLPPRSVGEVRPRGHPGRGTWRNPALNCSTRKGPNRSGRHRLRPFQRRTLLFARGNNGLVFVERRGQKVAQHVPAGSLCPPGEDARTIPDNSVLRLYSYVGVVATSTSSPSASLPICDLSAQLEQLLIAGVRCRVGDVRTVGIRVDQDSTCPWRLRGRVYPGSQMLTEQHDPIWPFQGQ